MTHLEKFIELYAEFGIECKVNENSDCLIILMAREEDIDEGATHSKKFGGYSYFFTEVTFDLKGNFVKQEFWE